MNFHFFIDHEGVVRVGTKAACEYCEVPHRSIVQRIKDEVKTRSSSKNLLQEFKGQQSIQLFITMEQFESAIKSRRKINKKTKDNLENLKSRAAGFASMWKKQTEKIPNSAARLPELRSAHSIENSTTNLLTEKALDSVSKQLDIFTVHNKHMEKVIDRLSDLTTAALQMANGQKDWRVSRRQEIIARLGMTEAQFEIYYKTIAEHMVQDIPDITPNQLDDEIIEAITSQLNEHDREASSYA